MAFKKPGSTVGMAQSLIDQSIANIETKKRQGGRSMERDYETKGAILIRTKFGTVSVTEENFTISPEDVAERAEFLESVGAESGVFCLVPAQLNQPF